MRKVVDLGVGDFHGVLCMSTPLLGMDFGVRERQTRLCLILPWELGNLGLDCCFPGICFARQ